MTPSARMFIEMAALISGSEPAGNSIFFVSRASMLPSPPAIMMGLW